MAKKWLIFLLFLFMIGNFFYPSFSHADLASDLKQQIDEHNNTISQLEAEIKQYQIELDKTSSEAQTLSSIISVLNTNDKKLTAELNVTNQKISSTNLQIKELGLQIDDKQNHIVSNKDALAENIRSINELDNQSFIVNLLKYEDISEVWNTIEQSNQFIYSVKNHVSTIENLKSALEKNVSDTKKKKDELTYLKNGLNSQKQVIVENKNQQNLLLKQTKNKESNYQKLIADRKAKALVFQNELTQIESQLNLVINPNSIPSPNSGVLSWPIYPPYKVTQLFGDTAFSRTHLQVYNGNGHNGIDIGIPTGTKIKSASDGIVKGIGNTDLACPNASFGKWVLIEHNNGLSSLYAHLSVVGVKAGQHITDDEIIGLSGMTGYSTGPHLHFTVYATQGVEISNYNFKSCSSKSIKMPIATLKAYLNPLLYLSNDYKYVD
jgi:murein DD-endopeptidase MepM/ murein hydrolase activator NlpD